MKLKIAILVSFAFAHAAWASKPLGSGVMSELESRGTPDTLAMAAQSPAQRIELEKMVKSKLDADARTVSYRGVASYYRAFEVSADSDGDLTFEVVSICACFGFDKRIAVPVALAFDAHGNEVAITNEPNSKGGFGLLALTGRFHVSSGTPVHLLVLSDNSAIDQTVQTIDLVTQYGSTVATLPARSYPTGKFKLTIHAVH